MMMEMNSRRMLALPANVAMVQLVVLLKTALNVNQGQNLSTFLINAALSA